jgi:hypothetical protein
MCGDTTYYVDTRSTHVSSLLTIKCPHPHLITHLITHYSLHISLHIITHLSTQAAKQTKSVQ